MANLGRVILGKSQALEWVAISLLCGGHVLIDDVPGVGKTMLARSLARSLGCSFSRVQFTPDLLPSDITGVSVYDPRTGSFEFRAGPILAQIVLADEINRATPKTQSALLEAMDERQVTVDGVSHAIPLPSMVLATQNPIEFEGTFPLPEAQLDRFFMKISLGYPALHDEVRILQSQQYEHPIVDLAAITDAEEILRVQEMIKSVYVSPAVERYIVEVVAATREHHDVLLGASPRGSLALFRGAQARAAIQERDYALPDDVKALAEPILRHRLVLNPAARLNQLSPEEVIQDILARQAVPTGSFEE